MKKRQKNKTVWDLGFLCLNVEFCVLPYVLIRQILKKVSLFLVFLIKEKIYHKKSKYTKSFPPDRILLLLQLMTKYTV